MTVNAFNFVISLVRQIFLDFFFFFAFFLNSMKFSFTQINTTINLKLTYNYVKYHVSTLDFKLANISVGIWKNINDQLPECIYKNKLHINQLFIMICIDLNLM